MNFSAKNPALRQAANRYRQLYNDTANIQQTDQTLASFGFCNDKLLTTFAL